MEYAKDEIFTIEYSDSKNKKFNDKDILKLVVSIGIVFCTANIFCIYNFFKVLSNL